MPRAAPSSLVGIDGLTLSGSAQVRINNTGKTVDESIRVPGVPSPVQVKFDSAADVQFVGGMMDLAISNFVTLHGNFSFSK